MRVIGTMHSRNKETHVFAEKFVKISQKTRGCGSVRESKTIMRNSSHWCRRKHYITLSWKSTACFFCSNIHLYRKYEYIQNTFFSTKWIIFLPMDCKLILPLWRGSCITFLHILWSLIDLYSCPLHTFLLLQLLLLPNIFSFLQLSKKAEGRQGGVMIKMVMLGARRIMKEIKLALIWFCLINQHHSCDKTCFSSS